MSISKRIEIEQNKYLAAINTAERHVSEGKKPMPYVVDEKYRQVYLDKYEEVAGYAVSDWQAS